ncbi:MAG: winged helix-turn-helix transcriptional regulator [Bacteriovoracaceae bacterium]|nr:winged helix-turn-helix transcriptional regulator [Bacteriovoracaceae bacterium]
MKCLPKNKQEVTEEDKSLAKLCRALGHDARVHIVKMLLHDDLCICNDFVDTLPLSQSTVSQHIKVLKDADLIIQVKQTSKICYVLNHDTFKKLRTLIVGL